MYKAMLVQTVALHFLHTVYKPYSVAMHNKKTTMIINCLSHNKSVSEEHNFVAKESSLATSGVIYDLE